MPLFVVDTGVEHVPKKRLEVVVDGRKIVAINTWLSGAWLEIDGEVHRHDPRLFNIQAHTPMLEAVAIGASGQPLHIEVFIVALLRVHMMIAVNGQRVAGRPMHHKEEAAARRAQERLSSTAATGGGGTSVAVPVTTSRRR
jgi:hypothetical protein